MSKLSDTIEGLFPGILEIRHTGKAKVVDCECEVMFVTIEVKLDENCWVEVVVDTESFFDDSDYAQYRVARRNLR